MHNVGPHTRRRIDASENNVTVSIGTFQHAALHGGELHVITGSGNAANHASYPSRVIPTNASLVPVSPQ